MTNELLLVSAEDGASLSFSCNNGSNYQIAVTAAGRGFSVATSVYSYSSPSLSKFFDEIAESNPSENGTFLWETLEGELRLEVTRDLLGHIFLVFYMRSPDIGSNRWWSFTGRLVLELGAMKSLCKRVHKFWNAAAT